MDDVRLLYSCRRRIFYDAATQYNVVTINIYNIISLVGGKATTNDRVGRKVWRGVVYACRSNQQIGRWWWPRFRRCCRTTKRIIGNRKKPIGFYPVFREKKKIKKFHPCRETMADSLRATVAPGKRRHRTKRPRGENRIKKKNRRTDGERYYDSSRDVSSTFRTRTKFHVHNYVGGGGGGVSERAMAPCVCVRVCERVRQRQRQTRVRVHSARTSRAALAECIDFFCFHVRPGNVAAATLPKRKKRRLRRRQWGALPSARCGGGNTIRTIIIHLHDNNVITAGSV